MTTVRIESLDPLDAEAGEDLLRLLRQQQRPEGWAEQLVQDVRGSAPGRFGSLLRAADDAGRTLGGALVLDRREPGESEERPWLAALWVDAEVRSQGLGRKLVQMAEQAARERGAHELVITASPEDDATLFMTERWGYFRESLVLSKNL